MSLKYVFLVGVLSVAGCAQDIEASYKKIFYHKSSCTVVVEGEVVDMCLSGDYKNMIAGL